jgi:hypothetical protein
MAGVFEARSCRFRKERATTAKHEAFLHANLHAKMMKVAVLASLAASASAFTGAFTGKALVSGVRGSSALQMANLAATVGASAPLGVSAL